MSTLSSHLMPTYARQPVAFVRGQASTLWDVEGRAYLDGLSGIAVNTLGHNHPALVAALREQVGQLHAYVRAQARAEMARQAGGAK